MGRRWSSIALLLLLGCGGSDDDGSPSADAAAAPADAAISDPAPEPDAAVAVAGPSLAVTTMVPESVPRGSGSHTYILPQLSETAESVAGGAAGAVDTVIRAIYDGGQAGQPAGGGAQIDLYLVDRDTGSPLQGSTSAVCDPCVFNLGSTNRTVSASIADLVAAAGGFAGPVDAFALIVVAGADPDGVSLEATTRRLAPHPLSTSTAPLQPHSGVDNVFVIPHSTETAGDPLTAANARDLIVHVLYTGGLGPVADGGGAELDLYLFDASGDPLAGQDTTSVCNPCIVNVSSTGSDRAVSLRTEALMDAHGGLAALEVELYGVAVVGGADPSGAVVWATRSESSGQ